MRNLMIIAALLLSSGRIAAAEPASAGAQFERSLDFRTTCAGRIVPINSIPGGGVLYKPSNLHGGRGPSFLVQNVGERTGKQKIEVRDAKCRVIGSLGLFATDQPYGARYYSRSGGSGHEDDQFLALARQAGSNNILIEGVNKWIRVRNPTQRDGSVRK